jgi:uncharacterized membrane protein
MNRSDAAVRVVGNAVRAAAVAAILAGLFFRCYHLDRKTFWGDEIVGVVRALGYTEAEIVTAGPQIRSAADVQVYFQLAGPDHQGARPLSATVRAQAAEDPHHPPLYPLLIRVWGALAGLSPLALRIMPLVFGMLSIGAMAWLARELFGNPRAALVAASLYAISPFAVLYAQESREYSLWGLETLVSCALLLRAARLGSGRLWLAYAASLALSLYTYPFTLFVMTAHAVAVAASPSLRRRAVLLPYLAASIAAALLFLPWLLIMTGSATRVHAMNTLLANQTTALRTALTLVGNLKQNWADVGLVDGTAERLTRIAMANTVLAAALYALGRLARPSASAAADRFILALFVIPALPLLFLYGGSLVAQSRYFQPTYLAIPLAFTAWHEAALGKAQASALRASAFGAAYALILLICTWSCLASAAAPTWYNKDYQRTPAVAAIINRAERPLVVGDRMAANDRGTSRVLELAYYLDPGVAMRVNLSCDVCLIPAPAPIDVFADAGQFSNVFVLGKLVRTIPEGNYALRQIGTDINPGVDGPLEMFANYPR